MDWTATGFAAIDEEQRRRMRRVALGTVVSILVHSALLAAWRGGGEPAALPEPSRPLTVRVQPPPPPRVEAPAPPPAAARTPERPATRPPRRTAPAPVIALPPDTDAAGEPDPFIVEQPETPSTSAQTPRFDREAARRSARALAHMRDPPKEGTAIGQFPEPPLETESRAARAIGAAKRRDCKDGVPGGLLAPLLLAMDKKDSGCKW